MADFLYTNFIDYFYVIEGRLNRNRFNSLSADQQESWKRFAEKIIYNKDILFFSKLPFYKSRKKIVGKFLQENFLLYFIDQAIRVNPEKFNSQQKWNSIAKELLLNQELLIPKPSVFAVSITEAIKKNKERENCLVDFGQERFDRCKKIEKDLRASFQQKKRRKK